MFKTTIISALAMSVIAFGAQAASSDNPGKDQLARAAGVEAADYSTAELMRLLDAQRSGEAAEANFVQSHESRISGGTSSVTPGKAQLAATVGVNPTEYTTAEMMRIYDARIDGNAGEESFFLSGSNSKSANPAEVVTPGEAQLAAIAGVDPAQYTLAELTALQSSSDD